MLFVNANREYPHFPGRVSFQGETAGKETENMNKRQKILIVDDVKFNRDILKEFLGETYDYLEAENGNQAAQIMEENLGIDLMLLDINMPQMDV